MHELLLRDLEELKTKVENASEQFSKEGYRAVMLAGQWRNLGAAIPQSIADNAMVSLAENGPMFVNGVKY